VVEFYTKYPITLGLFQTQCTNLRTCCVFASHITTWRRPFRKSESTEEDLSPIFNTRFFSIEAFKYFHKKTYLKVWKRLLMAKYNICKQSYSSNNLTVILGKFGTNAKYIIYTKRTGYKILKKSLDKVLWMKKTRYIWKGKHNIKRKAQTMQRITPFDEPEHTQLNIICIHVLRESYNPYNYMSKYENTLKLLYRKNSTPSNRLSR
jgi:hypothetical protein